MCDSCVWLYHHFTLSKSINELINKNILCLKQSYEVGGFRNVIQVALQFGWYTGRHMDRVTKGEVSWGLRSKFRATLCGSCTGNRDRKIQTVQQIQYLCTESLHQQWVTQGLLDFQCHLKRISQATKNSYLYLQVAPVFCLMFLLR
jgi:hypothetical protein